MPKPSINPAAISPRDLATLLSRIGIGRIDVEMIEADVEDGAPTNSDGTLNLVHYCGWLVGEMGRNPSGDAHGP